MNQGGEELEAFVTGNAENLVNALVPFWCLTDPDGCILSFSNQFSSTIPALHIGSQIDNVFRVEHAGVMKALPDSNQPVELIVLEDVLSKNTFKCTKVQGSKGNIFLACALTSTDTQNRSGYELKENENPLLDATATCSALVNATNERIEKEPRTPKDSKTRNLLQLQKEKMFYQRILSEIPVDIAVFDKQHKYLFVNKAGIKSKQLRELIIGLDDFEYAERLGRSTAKAEERRKKFEYVVNNVKDVGWVQEHISDDGLRKSVLRRMIPITNESGELDFVLGYGLDVTELRAKEEQIESMSRFPLENPHVVIRCGLDGEILFANNAAEQSSLISKETGDQSLGRDLKSMLESVDDKGTSLNKVLYVDSQVFSATAIKVVGQNYVNIYAVDITSSKREIEAREQELVKARENLVRLNKMLEKRAEKSEETLRVAESELVAGEKLAVLGRLAAGVAHEMNTPLGAINSSADNLSNILRSMFKEGLKNADHSTIMEACKLADDFTAHDTLTSRQERAERKLLTETLQNTYGLTESTANEHASELVECGILSSDTEILDHVYGAKNVEIALSITTTIMKIRKSVSTIEVASQKAANVIRALKSYVRNDNVHSATVFDVRRSINDILLLFSNQLKKGVELHVEMDEQLLLQGNESELSKVWSNLIANALYAMNYSGNLWIKGRTDSLSVILEFINDGPTIPEDVMARLFEPFYTTKPIGEGSGMGLSIVFNIIASMNGSIEAESKERTTFTITLPKTSR